MVNYKKPKSVSTSPQQSYDPMTLPYIMFFGKNLGKEGETHTTIPPDNYIEEHGLDSL